MYSDLWDRVRAADTWQPEEFLSDPTITDYAAMMRAIADPLAAAPTISPLAAAACDIIAAGERAGILITIDVDTIILSRAASAVVAAAVPRASHADRVAIARFRLTLADAAGTYPSPAVEAAYAARPRGTPDSLGTWQICKYDRARTVPLPSCLEGAEYIYLPANRDIIVLLATCPENIDETCQEVRNYMFDVLGEVVYSTIQRRTILPKILATLSCDYALRPITVMAESLHTHFRIVSCDVCGVHNSNCPVTDDLCESCLSFTSSLNCVER